MYPAVFVYGNTATGKSLVVQKVLDVMKVQYKNILYSECKENLYTLIYLS